MVCVAAGCKDDGIGFLLFYGGVLFARVRRWQKPASVVFGQVQEWKLVLIHDYQNQSWSWWWMTQNRDQWRECKGNARTLVFTCVDRAYGKPKNANRRIIMTKAEE
jgi:hypothetical protein